MRSPDRRRPLSTRRRSPLPWSPPRRRKPSLRSMSFRDRDRKHSPSPPPRHRRRRSRSPRPRRDSWRHSRSKSPAFRRKSPHPVVQQEAESTVKEERRESLSPVDTQRYPPAAAAFAADARNISPPAKTEPITSRTSDYDSLEISTSGSAKKHHDQTSLSLDSRFTEECENPVNFIPKENISVGIDRNIPGNEPAIVGGQLFPEQVLITRRRGEGEVPLHKREEFLGPQDDDLSERRVIRVSKGDNAGAGLGGRDNFEVRRNVDGDERRRGKRFTSEVELHGDRDERVRLDRKQLIYATGFGDRDERMVVDRTEGNGSPHRDEDLRSARFSDRSPRRGHDLRHNLSKKRKDDAPFDARQRLSRRHESPNEGRHRDDSSRSRVKQKEEELPDFSLRPGKGEAVEWKARPDMIPKGSQYFEHDNRGERDYWERRGGGRGGGRGRGGRSSSSSSFRGRGSSFRGRGGSFRDSKKEEFEWKHDKFKELEEEKPSSTTK